LPVASLAHADRQRDPALAKSRVIAHAAVHQVRVRMMICSLTLRNLSALTPMYSISEIHRLPAHRRRRMDDRRSQGCEQIAERSARPQRRRRYPPANSGWISFPLPSVNSGTNAQS
jgi:hypothetical protein